MCPGGLLKTGGAMTPEHRACQLHLFVALVCFVCVGLSPTRATGQLADEAPRDGIEQYLETLGLERLQAVHLEEAIDELIGEERQHAARRLARLYGRLLERETDADERRDLQRRSQRLLRLVPEEYADELRLTLVKARYFNTERESQASLLAAASPAEDEELARTLLELVPDLKDIAGKADSDIRRLERRLNAGRGDFDEQALRNDLDTLRSLRSQAHYYLGWAQTEIARLTGQSRHADAAIESFAWLLGAAGQREPSVEGVAPGLLGYAHVARAALGCARAQALRGDSVNASRWLELVVDAGDAIPEEVREQLLAHQIIVLSLARRWADLQVVVDEAHAEDESGPSMLSPLEARLLAVLTLRAMTDASAGSLSGPIGEARTRLLEALAQVALGDLVEHGALGEILAIVRRFGTLPIGQDGFIVHYVRGIRAVERAEAAQQAADEELGKVTAIDTVANRYAEAAALFERAFDAFDAERFTEEHAEAGVLGGRCLFVAGQFESAASMFERVLGLASISPAAAEEAHWNLLVALDRAIAGGAASLTDRRDELSKEFLERFPASQRAAELLIRRVDGGGVSREEAIEILLAVEGDAPLAMAAKKMAVSLLFDTYRSSPAAVRSAAADRFLLEATQLRRRLEVSADGSDPSDGYRMGLTRQMLDAAFATDPAALTLARDLIDELSERLSDRVESDPLVGELRYRALQLALAQQNDTQVQRAFALLEQSGAPYLEFGISLLYERASRRMRASEDDLAAASDVVRFGQRMLSNLLSEAADEATLEQRRGVQSDVIIAAERLDKALASAGGASSGSGDDVFLEVARGLAMDFAEQLREEGRASLAVLMAHARLAGRHGDIASSLESWRLVMAALDSSSPAWLEARLSSLELLVQVDPQRAATVLAQFDTLYNQALSDEHAARKERIERALNMPADAPTSEQGGGA